MVQGDMPVQYWHDTQLVILMFDLQRLHTVDVMLQCLSKCVKFWARLSESGVKYIVIGGKADLQSIDTEAWEQIKWQCNEIAPIEDFFWVSSKADIDIAAVKDRIFELLFRDHDWADEQMRYEGLVYLPSQEAWWRMVGSHQSSNSAVKLPCTIQ